MAVTSTGPITTEAGILPSSTKITPTVGAEWTLVAVYGTDSPVSYSFYQDDLHTTPFAPADLKGGWEGVFIGAEYSPASPGGNETYAYAYMVRSEGAPFWMDQVGLPVPGVTDGWCFDGLLDVGSYFTGSQGEVFENDPMLFTGEVGVVDAGCLWVAVGYTSTYSGSTKTLLPSALNTGDFSAPIIGEAGFGVDTAEDTTLSSTTYAASNYSGFVGYLQLLTFFDEPPEPPEPGAVGAEVFEFTHRWPIMGPQLLTSPGQAVDLLERHDQELEEHFATHGCGDFEYTFRWATFYQRLLNGDRMDAVRIMETRDQELELASAHQGEDLGTPPEDYEYVNDGSCEIALTHRWNEIIDLFRAGDARAWDLLETRDQEIEAARSACACLIEDDDGGEG